MSKDSEAINLKQIKFKLNFKNDIQLFTSNKILKYANPTSTKTDLYVSTAYTFPPFQCDDQNQLS